MEKLALEKKGYFMHYCSIEYLITYMFTFIKHTFS